MMPDLLISSLSLSISSSIQEVRKLGLAVREFCSHTSFDEIEIYHVELAVVEAANNVILHTYKGEEGHRLDLTVFLFHDKISLILTDTGEPVEKLNVPDTLIINPGFLSDVPQGKMGLYLIHTVMDEVQSSSSDGVNQIIMTKFFEIK
jgi:serine/threonine-protein kinase RsbW